MLIQFHIVIQKFICLLPIATRLRVQGEMMIRLLGFLHTINYFIDYSFQLYKKMYFLFLINKNFSPIDYYYTLLFV